MTDFDALSDIVFDTLSREEAIVLLRQALTVVPALETQVLSLRAQVAALEAELIRLRKDPPSGVARAVPSFVKPNVPGDGDVQGNKDAKAKKEKRLRKPRRHSFARLRETPDKVTEQVTHYPQSCSCCGRALSGGWLHRSRQVIELPAVAVRVIEHRVMARHCGVCNRREVARPDFSGIALGTNGKSRMGIKLTGLIAYLDTVCRMPVRLIKGLLDGLYGLSVSTGEISELLHRVAKRGQAFYQSLLSELRSSSVVHADETGFREDGRNGYVWSFSNPASRYYTYSPSRSGQVARDALGGFSQSLVSDFYGGYNWYRGLHQYCWVHLLRDLKKLGEEHPKDRSVARFIEGVRIIYEEAKAFTSESVFARQKKRRTFQARLCALVRWHIGEKEEERPERVLAERILKYQYGMFVFVERPEVPSDNNAAERAIRPFVALRKVTGGTRSRQGSDTQAVLMSLFETWKLRGENPLTACQQMLIAPTQATG
jgi:hypothetical protein